MRDELQKFAEAMEIKLKKKDMVYGDSWKGMSKHDLQDRLIGEMVEGLDAIKHDEGVDDELVDIANMCMMLWNRNKEDE